MPKGGALLTQEQVAEIMGISRHQVDYLERQAVKKIVQGLLADPVLKKLYEDEFCEK